MGTRLSLRPLLSRGHRKCTASGAIRAARMRNHVLRQSRLGRYASGWETQHDLTKTEYRVAVPDHYSQAPTAGSLPRPFAGGIGNARGCLRQELGANVVDRLATA